MKTGRKLGTLVALIVLSALPFVVVVVGYKQFGLGKGVIDSLLLGEQGRNERDDLTEEERAELLSRLAQQSPGLWDTLPEPKVGRVLQRNIRKTFKQAEIVSNRAGMRSSRPYVPKPPDVFRIVCLGDSFVMGSAGREEDRFGDQIEAILTESLGTVDGKTIEVYSLGVGSWSTVNAVAYLSSRLSEYKPDIVLGQMTTNDLSDTMGVRGVGQLTYDFSPEHRALGSGVVSHDWPSRFQVSTGNLLNTGIGHESRARWGKAFRAWKRLEVLLEQQGATMVVGVQGWEPFALAAAEAAEQVDLQSSLIHLDFLGERLPHDPHPNAAGHRHLALHFLHTLASTGQLPLDSSALPPLDKRLQPTALGADSARLEELQRAMVDGRLVENLDFREIPTGAVTGFLGGLHPQNLSEPLAAPPFGSPKSVFLLRRRPGSTHVTVEVEVPDYPELFPFRLGMRLDGQPAAVLDLERVEEHGVHRLRGAIPPNAAQPWVVEVELRTDAYWTNIVNGTMKSYVLLSASQD
jgi:hypothetical protein